MFETGSGYILLGLFDIVELSQRRVVSVRFIFPFSETKNINQTREEKREEEKLKKKTDRCVC